MGELNEVQLVSIVSWKYTDSGAYRGASSSSCGHRSPPDTPPPFFSEFITEHLEEATASAERFMQIANDYAGGQMDSMVVNAATVEKNQRPGCKR